MAPDDLPLRAELALLADGDYTLKVHRTAAFMRHDEINGKRFQEPVEVEFTDVHIERGTTDSNAPERPHDSGGACICVSG